MVLASATTSCSAAAKAGARTSYSASEFTLLGDPLVRLVWALDAVLLVLTMGREQRRDRVQGGRAGAPKRPGCVGDRLAHLELVIAHATFPFAGYPCFAGDLA